MEPGETAESEDYKYSYFPAFLLLMSGRVVDWSLSLFCILIAISLGLLP